MKVIKKINTSAVLALDSNGEEIIVIGRGLGFPKTPYELNDLSKVERTFYEVGQQYHGLIASLPKNILLASSEIAEQAEIELRCSLNPNLPFTLADHLNFAKSRLDQGIYLTSPISYDIQHLYPKEAKLGVTALEIMKQFSGVELPKDEAVNIAMHLINAEAESGNLHALMEAMNIIKDIENVVEQHLKIKLDQESYNYSRFIIHLRYLLQRLSRNEQTENRGADMLRTLAREYPDVYLCALKVVEYLQQKWKWKCNEEETLYLMLHIHRVQEKTNLE